MLSCPAMNFDRLSMLAKAGELPPLPKPDAQGNYPAVEYARAGLARKLIRDRVAAGLSQRELATLAGVRVETLCRIETGKHTPSIPTVDKLDRALKRCAVNRKANGEGRGETRGERNSERVRWLPASPHDLQRSVAMLPPRPIHDDHDLANATEVIDRMAGFPLNPDQEDYQEAIATFVEAYEAERFPVEDSQLTPLDALKAAPGRARHERLGPGKAVGQPHAGDAHPVGPAGFEQGAYQEAGRAF